MHRDDSEPAEPGSIAVLEPGATEAPPAPPPQKVDERVLTTKQLAWRRFKRHKLAIGSTLILLALGWVVILASVISTFNFHDPIFTDTLQGPSLNDCSR